VHIAQMAVLVEQTAHLELVIFGQVVVVAQGGAKLAVTAAKVGAAAELEVLLV
jgi:hypothetical protein